MKENQISGICRKRVEVTSQLYKPIFSTKFAGLGSGKPPKKIAQQVRKCCDLPWKMKGSSQIPTKHIAHMLGLRDLAKSTEY